MKEKIITLIVILITLLSVLFLGVHASNKQTEIWLKNCNIIFGENNYTIYQEDNSSNCGLKWYHLNQGGCFKCKKIEFLNEIKSGDEELEKKYLK